MVRVTAQCIRKAPSAGCAQTSTGSMGTTSVSGEGILAPITNTITNFTDDITRSMTAY